MATTQLQSEKGKKVYLKKAGRAIFGRGSFEVARVVQCDEMGHCLSLILLRKGNPVVIPPGHHNVGMNPIFSADAVMYRRPARRRRV